MKNSMNEKVIERFGEITLLNIDTGIEGGNIRICNEDDYVDNTIVTIDEIMSLYTLSSTQNYIFFETQNNRYIYKDGYFEIESPFEYWRFTKKDFYALCEYIYRLEKERIANE